MREDGGNELAELEAAQRRFSADEEADDRSRPDAARYALSAGARLDAGHVRTGPSRQSPFFPTPVSSGGVEVFSGICCSSPSFHLRRLNVSEKKRRLEQNASWRFSLQHS